MVCRLASPVRSRQSRASETPGPALAIISQSGGFVAHLRQAFDGRNLPVSYTVSPATRPVSISSTSCNFSRNRPVNQRDRALCENTSVARRNFWNAAKAARAAGKPVIMMHAGRGQAAQKAAASRIPARSPATSDVMRTQVTHAGVALVETLDELADTPEILARYPEPPTKGVGILTFSGAFCAIAHDFCEIDRLRGAADVATVSRDIEEASAGVHLAAQSARPYDAADLGTRSRRNSAPRPCSMIRRSAAW